ncbi:phosphodiester glycosidase family protein [Streptomyces sp. NPDC021356]|uniref:phosphodiester glycosidase family protein n=1 Tax=Streptomyces sp. NPDC021356 TaxID=3154900 RepID=UPI0033C00BC7
MGETGRNALAATALCLALAACSAHPVPDGTTAGARASAVPSPSAPPLPAGFGYRELTRWLDADSPVRLSVVSVAPDARVRVTGVQGPGMNRGRKVRDLAESVGALAAVNGTYFDIAGGRDHSGYEGDPIGLYAEHGTVLSEALAGRPALLIGRARGRLLARVAEVSTTGRLRAADGAGRELDGVDRAPGRILGCGGVGGDRIAATGRLRGTPYNGLCTDADEVVSFTREWGTDTPAGPPGSREALLSANGTVLAVRSPAGGPLPEAGSVLYGTGTGADWLRAHAGTGTRVAASMRITTVDGEAVAGPVETAVGGSARLLRDGVPDEDSLRLLRPSREPRTAAGVTADGTLLLVTIDGRRSGVSVGATPREAARLLRTLGAVDALNLDGGGSTTAVFRGQLRNSPRAAWNAAPTERRVADALAVLPG